MRSRLLTREVVPAAAAVTFESFAGDELTVRMGSIQGTMNSQAISNAFTYCGSDSEWLSLAPMASSRRLNKAISCGKGRAKLRDLLSGTGMAATAKAASGRRTPW